MDGLLSVAKQKLFSYLFLNYIIIMAVFQTTSITKDSLYLILMTNVLGIFYFLQSHDWIISIIAWEQQNISLYLLVCTQCNSFATLSASIKYFLLSALATSFFLLGVTLLYMFTTSTNYDINFLISFFLNPLDYDLLLPISFIALTFLFKLGAAPFYNWSPDLYDSLPTPITVWMIIVVKLAILLFLIQPFIFLFIRSVLFLFFISGILSVLVGSFGLIAQFKIKRLLAYSAISHLGYILLAQASTSSTSMNIDHLSSFFFYTFIYFITSLCVFAVLCSLNTSSFDILYISQLAGLYLCNSALALSLSFCLFSLAGKWNACSYDLIDFIKLYAKTSM